MLIIEITIFTLEDAKNSLTSGSPTIFHGKQFDK